MKYFIALITLMLLPFIGTTQNITYSLKEQRISTPTWDTLLLEAYSTSVLIIEETDSTYLQVIITDENGNITRIENPKCVIKARGPKSGNFYFGYFFEAVTDSPNEYGVAVEFFLNPHDNSFRVEISLLNSAIRFGETVLRPFPPVRPAKTTPVKPNMVRN